HYDCKSVAGHQDRDQKGHQHHSVAVALNSASDSLRRLSFATANERLLLYSLIVIPTAVEGWSERDDRYERSSGQSSVDGAGGTPGESRRTNEFNRCSEKDLGCQNRGAWRVQLSSTKSKRTAAFRAVDLFC